MEKEGAIMETLHLRADHNVIEQIMTVVNQYSREGQEIEIIDNVAFKLEQKMILKGLAQEQSNQITSHEDMWSELLK
jgi:hypothetical protein